MSTPQFTSIAPTTGTNLGGQVATIKGTGLTNVTSVLFGGSSIVPSSVSSTSITCTTPAGTAGTSVAVVGVNSNTVWGKNTSSPVGNLGFTDVSVSPTTGQYQVACINNGFAYLSSNYGITWALLGGLPTSVQTWNSCAISDNGTYIALCADTNGYYTTSSGTATTPTWTHYLAGYSGFSSIQMSASGQYMGLFYWSGSNSYSYNSSSYGVWPDALITSLKFTCLAISSGSALYKTAIKSGSSIYRSTNGGVNWAVVTGTPTTTWTYVAMSSSGQYQTATTQTGIYYSNDNGSTWTKSGDLGTTNWNSVAMDTTGQYQTAVSGNSSSIAYSTNYGVNWTLYAYSISSNLSVSMGGTNGLYQTAVGAGGMFLLGAQSNSLSYTYSNTTPYITSLSSYSGSFGGNQQVTIQGANLTSAQNVTFGITPATNLSVTSTQITCTTPAGPPSATVNVTVTGSTGIPSNSLQYTYTAAPVITSIVPTSGIDVGYQEVTITGSGFTGALYTNSVKFNGNIASNINIVSDTSITCYTPAGNDGYVGVTVTVAGVASNSVQYQYTNYTPYISSLSPNNGYIGGSIIISGSALSNPFKVTFGTVTATVSSSTDSSITCVIPSATGIVDVTVYGSASTGSVPSNVKSFRYQ